MIKLARISKRLHHSLFLRFQQNYFDDLTKLFSNLFSNPIKF